MHHNKKEKAVIVAQEDTSSATHSEAATVASMDRVVGLNSNAPLPTPCVDTDCAGALYTMPNDHAICSNDQEEMPSQSQSEVVSDENKSTSCAQQQHDDVGEQSSTQQQLEPDDSDNNIDGISHKETGDSSHSSPAGAFTNSTDAPTPSSSSSSDEPQKSFVEQDDPINNINEDVDKELDDCNLGHKSSKETGGTESSAIGSEEGVKEEDEEADEGDFVAIELVVSSKNSEPQQSPINNSMSQSASMMNPDDPELVNLIPTSTTANAGDTFDANNAAPINHGYRRTTHAMSQHHQQQHPLPARRKILQHPILTPLTRVPWGKFISAAGACDVLFNCKYSMRQVEDEVREDQRRIEYDSTYDGNYEEGDEGVQQQQQQRVGREDGYANVSLGHECSDFHHYGEEEDGLGCDAEDMAEIGLSCCSMLDEEVNEDEQDAVNESGGIVIGLREGEEHDEPDQIDSTQGHCATGEQQKADSQETHAPLHQGENNTTQTTPATNTGPDLLVSDAQKAEISWKHSNPTLDMMFYRTMMNE